MTEQWLPVVGYEGAYEVSSKGRARSVDRVVIRRDGKRVACKGQFLAGGTARGYRFVGLSAGKGRCVRRKIAVLMLEAFVGPKPFRGAKARHLNDVRGDDRLDNLAWGTHSDNMRDKVRNGHDHNARKTRCRNGHDYTPENTRVRPNGTRNCRACNRDRYHARKAS